MPILIYSVFWAIYNCCSFFKENLPSFILKHDDFTLTLTIYVANLSADYFMNRSQCNTGFAKSLA